MIAFIAHDIASWIGVPTALVIVAMVMLRKWGKSRLTHRQQARQQPTSLGQSTQSVRPTHE